MADEEWHGHRDSEGLKLRLDKKVALITGGYGGMGRASARLFAKEGATVFIAGRNKERGDALAAGINDGGGRAYFAELDIVNQNQWDAVVARIKGQAGALHVLINIVGSNALIRFPKIDIDEWNKIFEIKVTGTLRGGCRVISDVHSVNPGKYHSCLRRRRRHRSIHLPRTQMASRQRDRFGRTCQ